MQQFSPSRLRAALLAYGQRPEVVALAIGRGVDSLRGYAAGRVVPPLPVLTRLADVLDVDARDLFEEVDR